VIGTLLNASAIVIGGIAGLVARKPLSPSFQNFAKTALGALAAFFGLRLVWVGLNGSFLQILKQFGVLLLAVTAGKLAGRLLRLQKASNRLGQFARSRIAASKPGDPARFTSGFLTCTALFCAAPLGILGAVCDGLPVQGSDSGYFYPLAVKAGMEGLAAMGFVSVFGWGVILSAIPVLVFQGTVTLLCSRFLEPVLAQGWVDSIHVAAGLLITCVALIIFEIRRIEVTDYLPALVLAPLFTRWLLG
jgi:uncharacterized membrane protein YqgA involved in biofilm formation